jgi:uroporphyrinogen III methyltransferase/synthase
VDAVDVYRTVPETTLDPDVRGQITRGEIDVVTFASPSSVRGLISLLGSTADIARMTVICVGQVTAAAARTHGLPVHGVAADPSAAGIVEAVVAWRRSPAVAAQVAGGDHADELTGDTIGDATTGTGREG